MSIGVDELLELSRAVSKEVNARVIVAAVASTSGDAGRAELLVTVTGCHARPCRLVLNIDRSTRAAVERDLSERLPVAIAEASNSRFSVLSMRWIA